MLRFFISENTLTFFVGRGVRATRRYRRRAPAFRCSSVSGVRFSFVGARIFRCQCQTKEKRQRRRKTTINNHRNRPPSSNEAFTRSGRRARLARCIRPAGPGRRSRRGITILVRLPWTSIIACVRTGSHVASFIDANSRRNSVSIAAHRGKGRRIATRKVAFDVGVCYSIHGLVPSAPFFFVRRRSSARSSHGVYGGDTSGPHAKMTRPDFVRVWTPIGAIPLL